MKKIGILTLPLHTNYGGILQAFALYRVLEELGYQPFLLVKLRESPFKRFVKRTATSAIRIMKPNFIRKPEWLERKAIKIKGFIERNLPNALERYDFRNLKRFGFYAIVVGSDQVWRKWSIDIRLYFLNFAENWNIHRVAYAASFGISDWEYTTGETTDCARLIKKFDAVSVREEEGVSLCRNRLRVEALCVLDPTMLLNPLDYLNVCSVVERSAAGFVSYVLDSDNARDEVVAALENALGTKNEPIMGKLNFSHDAAQIVPLMGVEEWLGRIASSNFVFTDSFHGCVFSIIFNRPFVVMINKGRGSSRFDTLLSKFGLTGRIAATAEDAVRIAAEAIDWDAVNKKRNELRKESLKFLREALGGTSM